MGDGKFTTHAPQTRLGVGPTTTGGTRRAVPFSEMISLDTEGTAVSAPPEPAAGTDLTPGTLINQYELIRELGRGGMGVVYAARDRQLGRRVAIKFLRDVTEEVAERFLIEARATAQCNHENIVIIYEANTYESMPYMVLELLDGFPLRELMGEFGAGNLLPASRVIELMLPVARGLARAHESGIIHRDLKPENIHVTHGGQVKVLDFGIAKAKDAASSQPGRRPQLASLQLTNAGSLVGTLPYMSPEQAAGNVLDHRSDLFALGIIMFEMLTGKHPVEPLDTEALFENLVSPTPMRSARTISGVPLELADLIDRCLAKSREHRMPDAHELARSLEALLPDRRGRRLAEGESPYPGLTAFQETDADRFFGRSRDIARMAARIRELPLTAVVGPSGVGKSSFVRAGVGPSLKASGERWDIVTIRPGRQPLASLTSILDRAIAGSNASNFDQIKLMDRIRSEPGYLGTALRERARELGSTILVFVDQFEELYTLVPDPAERHAFTTALRAIADDAAAPLRVVISMRSDLLDRVAEDARFLEELTRGMVFLAPPDREGLREALVAPIEMVGYRFESPEMVEAILEALGYTSGALPLLQFAAGKLWEARSREQRLLTMDSYRAIGGISGALATHADQVIASMSSGARQLARTVLRQLVTPERTRAIADLTELHQLSADRAEIARVVDQLVEARLLVVQTRDAGSTVELVHESLILSWPTLKRWLDDDAEDAQFRSQLAVAAKQWDAKGRATGLLWRGDAMEEARRWFDARPREIAPRDLAFLDAVFALAKRGKRRRLIAQVVAFTLLAGIAVVASVAYVNVNAAKQRVKESLASYETAEQLRLAEQRKANAASDDKNAAIDDKNAAVIDKDTAVRQRAAAEAERAATNEKLQGKEAQLQTKEAQLQTKEAELRKQNVELERKASEARAAQQLAERATADAKRIAEKLELSRRTLEVKLADETKRREEAERRAKGLSKELK